MAYPVREICGYKQWGIPPLGAASLRNLSVWDVTPRLLLALLLQLNKGTKRARVNLARKCCRGRAVRHFTLAGSAGATAPLQLPDLCIVQGKTQYLFAIWLASCAGKKLKMEQSLCQTFDLCGRSASCAGAPARRWAAPRRPLRWNKRPARHALSRPSLGVLLGKAFLAVSKEKEFYWLLKKRRKSKEITTQQMNGCAEGMTYPGWCDQQIAWRNHERDPVCFFVTGSEC